MSTSSTTTGTNTSNLSYNPAAQAMYNNLVQGGGNVIGQAIDQPFGGPAYQFGAQQANRGAQAGGQNIMQALTAGQQGSGMSGQAGAGFLMGQRAGAGRAVNAGASGANMGNVQQAFGRQMAGIGTGLSFAPQLMGSHGQFSQTQQKTGLGSWGIPMLSSILTALADKYMGGGGGGAGGGGGGGGGGCWIAAAVYDGWDDPRTIDVRRWLNTEFVKRPIGRAVMALYLQFGEQVAEMVKRSSLLKRLFRPLFDLALKKARGTN